LIDSLIDTALDFRLNAGTTAESVERMKNEKAASHADASLIELAARFVPLVGEQ